MRDVASTSATSSAPPEAFARRWADHEQTAPGEWCDRHRSLLGTVRMTYRADPRWDGGSELSGAVAIGGLLRALWATKLGAKMAEELPAHLEEEIAAAEAGQGPATPPAAG